MYKRFLLVIGLITFMGFIAAWQQIQTVRLGYRISETNKFREQVINEQKILKLKFTSLKSPEHLLATETSTAPEILTLNEINSRINNYLIVNNVALTPR
ncbi:MAG: hypothetical protein V1709_02100 [Planctomycetota bacterium]